MNNIMPEKLPLDELIKIVREEALLEHSADDTLNGDFDFWTQVSMTQDVHVQTNDDGMSPNFGKTEIWVYGMKENGETDTNNEAFLGNLI